MKIHKRMGEFFMKILIGADLVPTSQTASDFAAGNLDRLFGKVKNIARK